MWKIPFLSKLLLERKRRRIFCKTLKTDAIEASKFHDAVRRVSLQEWKDAIKQTGEQR